MEMLMSFPRYSHIRLWRSIVFRVLSSQQKSTIGEKFSTSLCFKLRKEKSLEFLLGGGGSNYA